MAKPPGYTHVVEVTAPGRIVYIAGQLGVDRDGKVVGDFRAQAVQTFENLKTALAAVGADFGHVLKFNNYLVDARICRSSARCATATCRSQPAGKHDHRDFGSGAGGGAHRDRGGGGAPAGHTVEGDIRFARREQGGKGRPAARPREENESKHAKTGSSTTTDQTM